MTVFILSLNIENFCSHCDFLSFLKASELVVTPTTAAVALRVSRSSEGGRIRGEDKGGGQGHAALPTPPLILGNYITTSGDVDSTGATYAGRTTLLRSTGAPQSDTW